MARRPCQAAEKANKVGGGDPDHIFVFFPQSMDPGVAPPPPDTHVLSALLFPTLCSPVYSSGDTGLPLEDFFFMATPVDKSYFINMYSYFLNRNVQNYSIIKKI